MQTRTPAVAGMFYAGKKNELENSIKQCFLHELGPGKQPPTQSERKIYGIICPHAGYPYSGPIACHSFYAISNYSPDVFIVVGPNHWGIGQNVATMTDCDWETPLGKVQVDSDIANEIMKNSDVVSDFFSHTKEHSLEVQIPMMQHIFKNFKIVPIALIDQSKQTAQKLGKIISKVMSGKNIMVIGSSDFTHYETNEFAHKQDAALIEPILKMDLDEFYSVLEKRNVTACGYGAIATTMVACKELGATKGELLKYATSGDVTKDNSSVVGYGSIIFT